MTAGPGSGKTEVLVSRALLLMLVRDVDPKSIFLITFTRKADKTPQGLDETAQELFLRQESDFVDYLYGNGVHDKWNSLTDDVEEGEQWRLFEEMYPPCRMSNQWRPKRKPSNIFNPLTAKGPRLYDKVEDTEYHLQRNQDEFIIEGVVDVLVQDDDSVEIWDYRVGKQPETESQLEDYKTQLYTYAKLFEYKNGELPDRGVIYFIGEDSSDLQRRNDIGIYRGI